MSEHSGDAAVLYEKKGPLAWITFNRPAALNSINVDVRELLPKAMEQAEADPEVRVILLRGAGERAFCAGADIKEFGVVDSIVEFRQERVHTRRWIDTLGESVKPMVAAIHGFCLGGGLELALTCDIRIASEDAQLGLTEVSLGILAGGGGTQRLSRVVGLGNALRMILSAERIDAREAHRIGLVSQVVPRDQLEAEAERLATVIASRAPLAVILTKEAVRRGYDMEMRDGLALEADLQALLWTTEDRLEAAAAFREKRKPVFKGR